MCIIDFFVEDGTIEFSDNKLVVLSASVANTKDITKEFLDNLNKISTNQLQQKEITDHDRYILNYKIETIKEMRN